eukprot:PITA_32221
MSIVEAAKAMLYDHDMPRFIWEKAYSTLVYIQNKVAHKMLGKMTAEEDLTGKRSKTLKDALEFVGALRVSTREHKQPNKYKALVTKVIEKEPYNYQDSTQYQVWQEGMAEEYNSMMLNGVWEVMPRLMDSVVVDSRWIYKIKYAADDSVEKYTARFVAKGFA